MSYITGPTNSPVSRLTGHLPGLVFGSDFSDSALLRTATVS